MVQHLKANKLINEDLSSFEWVRREWEKKGTVDIVMTKL